MVRKTVKGAAGLVLDMVRTAGRYNVARAAGALAYFFVLSFFPLLLCVNAFVGLAHVDFQALLLALERVLPREALTLAQDYVAYLAGNQSPALLLAGVPAILLSASAGLRVVLDTMDELYEHPRDTGLRRIVLSVVFSLLFLVTIYLSIVVVLTGDWFFRWLGQVLTLPLNMEAASGLWRRLRYLLLFCFVILLVLAVYRLGTPRRDVRPLPMLVSALLCSAALVVASALFSWFIGLSSRYSLLYGSLASLIILLVWLYLCGTILLLGAVFNRVWTKRHPRP